MLKKVIPIVLLLCLTFSISVKAENNEVLTEEIVPEISEQMPQEERGNMGMPPSIFDGQMPPEGINRGERPQGNFTRPQNAGEFTPPKGDFSFPQNNNAEAPSPNEENGASAENPQMPDGSKQFNGQMNGNMGGFPGNMQNFNMQTQENTPTGFLGFIKTNSTPIISVILLALAFVFVIFYRRKNY